MKKDTTLSIRLSKLELDVIRAEAKKAHLSQSDYVSQCCLGQQVVVMDGLKEVLTELKRIGNNVNQLAVLSNMGKLHAVNLDGVGSWQSSISSTTPAVQRAVSPAGA